MKEISKVKQKVHFIPCSSIHPFLSNDTQTELETTRSRGVRTPFNLTAGGSFVPSAATPRVTVKLRFSAPHDFTGTVRFPLNSSEWVDSSSKRIAVSSILKILDYTAAWLLSQSDGTPKFSPSCDLADVARGLFSFACSRSGGASSSGTIQGRPWIWKYLRGLLPSTAALIHWLQYLKDIKRWISLLAQLQLNTFLLSTLLCKPF